MRNSSESIARGTWNVYENTVIDRMQWKRNICKTLNIANNRYDEMKEEKITHLRIELADKP